MNTAALLFIETVDLVAKSPRRDVKKKNGLSSVEGAMFSGVAAKKAASALLDSKVEETSSNAMSGPRRIVNPSDSSLWRAPAHSASEKASGRVITVTILPTFRAITWRDRSAEDTPACCNALAAIANKR